MADPNDSKLLMEIHADVQVIKAKLDSDYRALYGNGHPGLIEEVANLKRDLAILKAKQSWFGTALAGWLSVIAWLVTTTVSVVSIILK